MFVGNCCGDNVIKTGAVDYAVTGTVELDGDKCDRICGMMNVIN